MTGCLFYFCAEWQKARRVILLDDEATIDLAFFVGPNGELDPSYPLVQQYGLQGWLLDLANASEVGFVPGGESGLSPERYRRNVTNGPPVPVPSCAGSLRRAVSSTYTNATGEPGSPTERIRPVTPPSLGGKLDSGSGCYSCSTVGTMSFAGQRGAESPSRMRAKSPDSRPNTGSGQRPNQRRKPGSCRAFLFTNPEHPFCGLPTKLSRDDFTVEMRKRLNTHGMFSESRHFPESDPQPILSVEELEDLFEALLIMQMTPNRQQTMLNTGRALDTVVDALGMLSRLRRIIERVCPSLTAFFNMLNLSATGVVEANELAHFFKHATNEDRGFIADALAMDGFDSSRLAEVVFAVLDANKDRKIDLQELQMQLSFAAPHRTSMLSLVSRCEMKYGFGKGCINKPMSRLQLYSHFCSAEALDLSPEDVAACFRQWAGTHADTLDESVLDGMSKVMPVEVYWGTEPHIADMVYDALGVRILQVERSRKMDANLPYEALLEDSEEAPDETELRHRFDQIWERYFESKGTITNSAVSSSLRQGCYHRFLEVARAISRFRLARRIPGVTRVLEPPRSLFPNIGDVLATSSLHLHAGQAFVVRYRLQGGSNFWHRDHVVRKNERDAMQWPVLRSVLGDTPFIGLVPRGIRWTHAGGGGFYLGSRAFTRVDPGLRTDLPMESTTGTPLLFGRVELVAPSLRRSHVESTENPIVEEFDLRIFCSRKQRIIACIGEPLPVRVVHHVRPGPLAVLQVRCEGRFARLRWSAMDCGPHVPPTNVDGVRLHTKSAHAESTLSLPTGTTEWAFENLDIDTEYEFRVRLENFLGPGRECFAKCRTNMRCTAPQRVHCSVSGTTSVDLSWMKPDTLGNEQTQDRYQSHKEAIQIFEATVTTGDKESHHTPQESDPADEAGVAVPRVRACQWPPSSWRVGSDGSIVVHLAGLVPDTQHSLSGLCAVNSMGPGVPASNFVFWTVPDAPKVANVRVTHGVVLIAMAQTGGNNVQEYSITMAVNGKPLSKKTVPLSASALRKPRDESQLPEIPLQLHSMPHAEQTETHYFEIRAINPGGWSEWGPTFDTVAIARQQGADLAQAALIRAIEAKEMEELDQVLRDVQDIELADERYIHQATELLQNLRDAHHGIVSAMDGRDPAELRVAIKRGREVKLPDMLGSDELLEQLDNVFEELAVAKGITALHAALDAARALLVPSKLLSDWVRKLGDREAAQFGLETAMQIARVPDVVEALRIGEGMHLPSQAAAEELLAALEHSEHLLKQALRSKRIVDLQAALGSAAESGLGEKELIDEAGEVLGRLLQEQADAQTRLKAAVLARHPAELFKAVEHARASQVPGEEVTDATVILKRLQKLLRQVESSEGVEERNRALEAAREAQLPPDLLANAEVQSNALETLITAVSRGNIFGLRKAFVHAETAGVRDVELAEASETHTEWSNALLEVDIASAVGVTDRLRAALQDATEAGIRKEDLEGAQKRLQSLVDRDEARKSLTAAVDARNCEEIFRALRRACDTDVKDAQLVTDAAKLLDHLLDLRVTLADGIKTGELKTLFAALEITRMQPALPESELVEAEQLLRMLQSDERAAIMDGLQDAIHNRNFRSIDSFILRARRSAAFGVSVGEEYLTEAQVLSLDIQEEDWANLETDLNKERRNDGPLPPELSQSVAVSASGAPGEPPAQIPHSRGSVLWPGGGSDFAMRNIAEDVQTTGAQLPSHTLRGALSLAHKAEGTRIHTVPREIVYCTLSVPLSEKEAADKNTVAAESVCQALLQSIAPMLDETDEMVPSTSYVIEDDGFDKRCELTVAIHIRSPNTVGEKFAESLYEWSMNGCEVSAQKGRPSGRASMMPSSRVSSIPAMDEDLEQGKLDGNCWTRICAKRLTTHITGAAMLREISQTKKKAAEGPKLLKYIRGVRVQTVRSVAVALSWGHPSGALDTLDASCLVFDGDAVIDIIDKRGKQGARFSTDRGGRRSQDSPDAAMGAVRHGGDSIDTKGRLGKQVIQVRLDRLPRRATDLLFVISGRNKNEIGRFQVLQSTVFEGDQMAELASHAYHNSGALEAILMFSLSREGDGEGLWHVNTLTKPLKGAALDYEAILAGSHTAGYPRNVAMKNLAKKVTNGVQYALQLPHHLKATGIKHTQLNDMQVNYVAELADGSAVREDYKDLLAGPDVRKAIVNSPGGLHLVSRERFKESSITLLPPPKPVLLDPDEVDFDPQLTCVEEECDPFVIKGELTQLRIDLGWSFPPANVDGQAQYDSFLDGTCFAFEGQALREIVDYRGAHGIRIVHNGIVDYSGVWVGNLGLGDALSGAVRFVGEEMDNRARAGKNIFTVDLKNLPTTTRSLFFVLSSPVNRDMRKYKNLSATLCDGTNPGHEIITISANTPTARCEAMVMCCLSRTDSGTWQCSPSKRTCNGTCADYRPAITYMRLMQQRACKDQPDGGAPEWPYRYGFSMEPHSGSAQEMLHPAKLTEIAEARRESQERGNARRRSSQRKSLIHALGLPPFEDGGEDAWGTPAAMTSSVPLKSMEDVRRKSGRLSSLGSSFAGTWGSLKKGSTMRKSKTVGM